MTSGQALALQQLRAVEQCGDAALTVEEFADAVDGNSCEARFTVLCGPLPRSAGGLPLREREEFTLYVPAEFPFVPPDICVRHSRFAIFPHVFWERYLCLFQAVDTEWDPSDGMFGFLDRLWTWLEHGARNELNPVNLPLHPPAVVRGYSSNLRIVPNADAPRTDGDAWHGFVELRKMNDWRVDVTSWRHYDPENLPSAFCAPAVLLPTTLPWQLPNKLSDLLALVEKGGLTRVKVFFLLQLALLVNGKDAPLLFVLGTPQRGRAAVGESRQHLMCWQLDTGMATSLSLAIEKYSEDERLQEIGERGEELAHQYADLIDVQWCRVLENRPEVTVRRDAGSPADVWRGKHICLWGCGALGSHVAYFLAKAGVRKLTLIDKGIVTPGLLVRQLYADADVALSKTSALQDELLRFRPELELETQHGNLLVEIAEGKDGAFGSEIIIDCTASEVVQAKTELARQTGNSGIPIISLLIGRRAERGIMVFVPGFYPSGLKGAYRRTKLEACRNPKSTEYLDDFYPQADVPFFQPEPGCSDATFVGSATDVSLLSAALLNIAARRLSNLENRGISAALVTRPDVPSMGDYVTNYHFPAELQIEGTYQIRINPLAWKEISAAIRRGRRRRGRSVETGGVLFGKRDEALRIVWVDWASGPPPDSRSSAAEFVCGTEGVAEEDARLRKSSRGSTSFVGMWHTHPDDAPAPSTRDFQGMIQMLTSGEIPLRHCLLLIVSLIGDQPVLGVGMYSRISSTAQWETITADLGLLRVPESFK